MGILASGVALCHLLSFLPMKERVCEEDKRLLVFFSPWLTPAEWKVQLVRKQTSLSGI
jgi:hypothetical protein